jgi:23S rRNA (cytosine1962-C5)-methyltransferase
MSVVILKKGRDKSLLRKHPWIFSGAIDSAKEVVQNGETIEVRSSDGKFLGWGSFSPHSQISVRIWSFNQDDKIDSDFFKLKIKQAVDLRSYIIQTETTNAYRIINAESDLLPGLIVDKYSNFLVCQFLSAGAEFWKNDIVKHLSELLNPTGIYERSNVDVRTKEGLKPTAGILFGKEPPDLLEILENEKKFFVDIKNGHKTGFYLDQRDNRLLLSQFCKEKEILNCFSFSGAFSVFALSGGANKITNIDSSAEALLLAEKNISLNGFSSSLYDNIHDDVFKHLRKLRDSNKQFDLIILDPPKFAESFNQITKASRAYKDINMLAFKLLKKGGVLFTFSCSGHITTELFNKIVADASLDAGRQVNIIKYLAQSPDHTVSTNFPEGLYLKGLFCKLN